MTGGGLPLSEAVASCPLFTVKHYEQRKKDHTPQFDSSISLEINNSPWVPRQ
jgi:hypothetical protein